MNLVSRDSMSDSRPKPSGGGAAGGRMLQLDGVRGLAILAVLVWHFEPFTSNYVSWGPVGVRLFFALSAFLVTGNLLRLRDAADAGESRLAILKRFYLGRYLRIIPIYYLTLFAALALGAWSVRDMFAWHLFFASNLYMGLYQYLTGESAHFWFLAAQEQFYLVWPAMLLFLPRHWLGGLIFGLIGFAALYRVAVVALDLNLFWYWILPFSNLDAIGAGAAVAWLRHRDGERALENLTRPGSGWLALVLFLVGALLNRPTYATWQGTLCELSMSLSFAWLVAGAARGFAGPGGRTLAWWPLVETGTVSYGLYVYHTFMPPALAGLFAMVGLGWPQDTYARLVLATAAAYAVAGLSWHLIEKPLAHYKPARRKR